MKRSSRSCAWNAIARRSWKRCARRCAKSRPIRVVVEGVHSSGLPLWLSLNITPILDADGRASHFVGIATDITQSIEDSRIKKKSCRNVSKPANRNATASRSNCAWRKSWKPSAALPRGAAHDYMVMQHVFDNVTFLSESVNDLASVIDAYRVDRARGDAVATEVEAEYLLTELPKAMQRARDGLKRVTDIVRAMKEFSHPSTEARSSADINKALETTLEVARSEYKQVAVVHLDLAPLPLVSCNIGELNQGFEHAGERCSRHRSFWKGRVQRLDQRRHPAPGRGDHHCIRRQRLRHQAGKSAQDLRPLLHDQGSGQGEQYATESKASQYPDCCRRFVLIIG